VWLAVSEWPARQTFEDILGCLVEATHHFPTAHLWHLRTPLVRVHLTADMG
jgi:hypothetical protein